MSQQTANELFWLVMGLSNGLLICAVLEYLRYKDAILEYLRSKDIKW